MKESFVIAKKKVQAYVKSLSDYAKSFSDDTKAYAKSLRDNAKSFSDDTKAYAKSLSDYAKSLSDYAKVYVKSLRDNAKSFSDYAKVYVKSLRDNAKSLRDNAKVYVKSLRDNAKSLSDDAKTYAKSLRDNAKSLSDDAKTYAKSLRDNAKAYVRKFLKDPWKTASDIQETITKSLKESASDIQETITKSLKESASDIQETITKSLKESASDIQTIIKDTWYSIVKGYSIAMFYIGSYKTSLSKLGEAIEGKGFSEDHNEFIIKVATAFERQNDKESKLFWESCFDFKNRDLQILQTDFLKKLVGVKSLLSPFIDDKKSISFDALIKVINNFSKYNISKYNKIAVNFSSLDNLVLYVDFIEANILNKYFLDTQFHKLFLIEKTEAVDLLVKYKDANERHNLIKENITPLENLKKSLLQLQENTINKEKLKDLFIFDKNPENETGGALAYTLKQLYRHLSRQVHPDKIKTVEALYSKFINQDKAALLWRLYRIKRDDISNKEEWFKQWFAKCQAAIKELLGDNAPSVESLNGLIQDPVEKIATMDWILLSLGKNHKNLYKLLSLGIEGFNEVGSIQHVEINDIFNMMQSKVNNENFDTSNKDYHLAIESFHPLKFIEQFNLEKEKDNLANLKTQLHKKILQSGPYKVFWEKIMELKNNWTDAEKIHFFKEVYHASCVHANNGSSSQEAPEYSTNEYSKIFDEVLSDDLSNYMRNVEPLAKFIASGTTTFVDKNDDGRLVFKVKVVQDENAGKQFHLCPQHSSIKDSSKYHEIFLEYNTESNTLFSVEEIPAQGADYQVFPECNPKSEPSFIMEEKISAQEADEEACSYIDDGHMCVVTTPFMDYISEEC